MPDLSFRVEQAEPVPHAAAPHLAFRLGIRAAEGVPIHSIMLRCQIRIEPARRRYRTPEQERLRDLFDRPDRWGQTLRPMLWTHAEALVPSFTGATVVDLPVPCTYDFNVAGTKYFAALEDGEVPLLFLFTGTIFHEAEGRGLQVAPIPWDKEATFRLPVRVWKGMMDHYYPDGAWLCLRKDVFDRLYQYKSDRGLPTWEQALESLLAAADQPRPR
jgi:hypothetical protein